MKAVKGKLYAILTIIVSVVFIVLIFYVVYNWGWRIGGFSNCVNPERYFVLGYIKDEENISILYEKGSYCTPTVGYISEQDDSTLKIGIKYYMGYPALITGNSWVEELVIPLDDNIEKIVFCGDGAEVDINEIYRPDILDTYPLDELPQLKRYAIEEPLIFNDIN